MVDTSANVPDIRTPFINPDTGQIDPVWWQFLLKLFVRTGSEQGNDGSQDHLAIAAAEGLLNSFGISPNATQRALAALSAQAYQTQGVFPKSVIELGNVSVHGIQTDPILHAQVTQTLDGFMIAADKLKLDGITAGAAIASVSGTAPIVSSGGSAPTISIVPATGSVPGSMSAADKTILDAASTGGTWTPTLTCATPGNLAVTYAIRVGQYTKIGRQVFANFIVNTSAFTWTTAVGQVSITGLPFAGNAAISQIPGHMDWAGMTKVGFTSMSSVMLPSVSSLVLVASGSGLGRAAVAIADLPSGGTVLLSGSISYFV